MAAMLALLLLALPLQATAWTAAPYTAPPANCGAQAVVSPLPASCFGAGGTLPSGWTCPAQPGSANGAYTRCVGAGGWTGQAPFPASPQKQKKE
jgi:hypothetical protein